MNYSKKTISKKHITAARESTEELHQNEHGVYNAMHLKESWEISLTIV